MGADGPLQGDSGGPLYVYEAESGRHILVGIVSGGVGECGLKMKPGKPFADFSIVKSAFA